MILLTESFNAHPQRRAEYDTCLNENIKNSLISKIVLFIDDPGYSPDPKFADSNKVTVHRVSQRPTYSDFFNYCNQNFAGEICIVTNSDIIIGNDLEKLNDRPWDNMFYALTRWDLKKKEDGTFSSVFFDNTRGIARASQDSWIFKAPIGIKFCDFPMGKPGCDNKLAHIAKESGMTVTNPSLVIKTYHLHESGIRNYSGRDLVPGPWQIVPPTESVDELSDLSGPWPF